MKPRTCRPIRWSALLLLCSCLPLAAQQPPTDQAQAAGQQGQVLFRNRSRHRTLQSISQTGLLPVYGVDARVDPPGGTAANFRARPLISRTPEQTPHSNKSGLLCNRPATVFFACRWTCVTQQPRQTARQISAYGTKNNNVQLILLLTAADPAKPIAGDISKKVADFAESARRSNARERWPVFGRTTRRIMAYQIEEGAQSLREARRHGQIRRAHVGSRLRRTRCETLSAMRWMFRTLGNSLMASASFDFDLVSAGAIAGGAMPDAAYSQAYQAL